MVDSELTKSADQNYQRKQVVLVTGSGGMVGHAIKDLVQKLTEGQHAVIQTGNE